MQGFIEFNGMGNLVSKPELKILPSGNVKATARIAVERKWKNKSTDKWVKSVKFFQLTFWARLAEAIEKMGEKALGSISVVTSI